MMHADPVVFVLTVISVLSGCSLNYEKAKDTESSIPEFIFTNVTFNRYEEGKLTIESSAVKIEQYKKGSATFAQGITFKTFNADRQIEAEGYCSLLSADPEIKQYTFFNNIDIVNHKLNLQIFAKNLHWNGETEQLTSGKNDAITLIRDNVTLTGKGFSASAVSNSFKFYGPVSGSIADKENKG